MLEPERGDIGEGVFPEVAQSLRDEEQDDRPAYKPADRIDQSVEAGGEDEPGNTEERRRRHVVAGDRKPVLESRDPAACGVEVRRGSGSARGPFRDAERRRDEDEEHDDRADVETLPVATFDRAGREYITEPAGEQEQPEPGEETIERAHHFIFSMIWRVIGSNLAFARRT